MATQINYNFTQTRPRVPIAAMFSGPGPGVYLLRGTTGFKLHDSTKRMNPAFSMGSRPRVITYSFTPGPAAYPIEKGLTRHGVDGTAKYSLKGRTQMGQQYNNPAPCDYYPEKHPDINSPAAPKYSFGSRTQLGKKDNFPGPNRYTLPENLGSKVVGKRSAPAYSMTGRSKIGSFHEDFQKTPGAGTYKVVDPNINKHRNPIYSMNGRSYPPGDSTLKPGPGVYSPEKHWVHKRKAPGFSFGIQHSEYIAPLIQDPID